MLKGSYILNVTAANVKEKLLIIIYLCLSNFLSFAYLNANMFTKTHITPNEPKPIPPYNPEYVKNDMYIPAEPPNKQHNR